jgi:hypothetical protein
VARRVEEADNPIVASLLAPLDRYLRRRQAIYEFSVNSACIFRLQELRLKYRVTLSNGTSFNPGERVLDLHLWNEHIPHLEVHSLRWALRMSECLDFSLRELAHYLQQRPDLSDIVAVRANMSFATAEQAAQLVRIANRYGFGPAAAPEACTLGERLHRFGENILVTFFVLAWNRAALRRDSLLRGRTQAFLPRAVLDQRYGAAVPRCAPQVSRERPRL